MVYSIFICIVLSVFCSCNVMAQGLGFGEVAANIEGPIDVVIHLVRAVSIICGSGLLMGGILRYIDYRRNPVAVRLSAVLYMFLFGVALIIVGLIPMHLYV